MNAIHISYDHERALILYDVIGEIRGEDLAAAMKDRRESYARYDALWDFSKALSGEIEMEDIKFLIEQTCALFDESGQVRSALVCNDIYKRTLVDCYKAYAEAYESPLVYAVFDTREGAMRWLEKAD